MTPDLEVVRGHPLRTITDAPLFHEWILPDGTPWTHFYRLGHDYLLRFPDLADFQVANDGRRIRAWPVMGVSDVTVQHLYLNQVLPLALSRQHKLVFHGSAIEILDQGVAFLGNSGVGKSTLAAHFATSGYRFLSDDCLAVECVEEKCWVSPSHASIRLWADSRDAVLSDNVTMAPAVSYTSKLRFLAGRQIDFCGEARALSRFYFLGDGSSTAPSIERMPAAQALIELVKNSFLLDIEAPELLAFHFDALHQLAALPIYYRLDYPRDYNKLAAVRQAILTDVNEQKVPN